MEANDLRENLSSGTATVTFTKADGTKRVMRCTRDASHIPKESVKPFNDTGDNVIVWDCDQNGWRQIRSNQVKDISY